MASKKQTPEERNKEMRSALAMFINIQVGVYFGHRKMYEETTLGEHLTRVLCDMTPEKYTKFIAEGA